MRSGKFIFSLFIILFLCWPVFAQDDCVIKLNEAERLYEEGKIEKIPEMLVACIKEGFNRENKIQALRLVTIVHLFEDNQQKAERTLLQLLKIDPEYKVNKAIDPIEFINLYNSFNTAPVFSAGFEMGVNFSKPHLLLTYSKTSFEYAQPVYTSGAPGLTFAGNLTYHLNNYWDICFEPSFSMVSFSLNENVGQTINYPDGSISPIVLNANENMNFVEFPVIGNYYFFKHDRYKFFGEGGLVYGMFISGTFNGDIFYTGDSDAFSDFEGSNIDNTDEVRNDYNLMMLIGAGAQVKLNRSNIKLSVRYNIGMNNMVNPSMRFEDFEGLNSDYQFIDNNYSLNRLSIMVGYNWEFYIHKKKPDNQSNYDIIR